MNSTKMKDWFEVFGVLAIVASLVFVGLEVRQSRQIAVMDQLGVFAGMQYDFRNMIADHPDVWRRGCLGEQLTAAEEMTFAQLVGQYESLAAITFMRGNVGLYQGSQMWLNNFAANIHRYPGIRDALLSGNEWRRFGDIAAADIQSAGGTLFRDLVETRLTDMVSAEPSPDADPMWCGKL